jgi:hypothetical protein
MSPASTSAAEPAAGPASGGLRLRLAVEPLNPMKVEGYNVRLELINASRREIEIRSAWEPGESGTIHDYLIAATRLETYPPLPPVHGATSGTIAELVVDTQPTLTLAAGKTETLTWQVKGRQLKNPLPNTGIGDVTEFPLPGLYSVHATLDIETSDGNFRLRSNEQLVRVGGSDAAPRHTYVPVTRAAPAKTRAELGAGSLHGVEVGDRFENMTKQASWRMTVVEVSPRYAEAKLELISAAEGVDGPPELPEFATLLIDDKAEPK